MNETIIIYKIMLPNSFFIGFLDYYILDKYIIHLKSDSIFKELKKEQLFLSRHEEYVLNFMNKLLQ